VLIEIRKAGFINKGAQLMLRATMQAISTRTPSARFTMTPSSSDGDQPISSIASEGLTAKLSVERAGLELGNLVRLVPSRLRSRYGVTLDREVDVVLDAAGFCYGAPWPSTNLAALAAASRRWRRLNRIEVYQTLWMQIPCLLAQTLLSRFPVSHRLIPLAIETQWRSFRMRRCFTELTGRPEAVICPV